MAFLQTKIIDNQLRITDNSTVDVGNVVWIMDAYYGKINFTVKKIDSNFINSDLNKTYYGIFCSYPSAMDWLSKNQHIFEKNLELLQAGIKSKVVSDATEKFRQSKFSDKSVFQNCLQNNALYLEAINHYLKISENSDAFYKNLIIVMLNDLKRKYTDDKAN